MNDVVLVRARANVAAVARGLTGRVRARSPDTLIAYALIVSAVLWRTWAALQWTFRWDDWLWVSDATKLPFLQYVTRVYNGHLQPGQFAIVWAVTKIAPLNYELAMAPVLIVTLVGGVLMWRFLCALFGERSANLIPLMVFMLCPLSVSAALWWTTALGIIPLQVLIVATLFAVLLYVRAPNTHHLIVVGVVYACALLVWEKSLLILPLVLLFVLLFLGEGSGRERLRAVSAGLWRLWLILVGITAPYVAWYLMVVPHRLAQRPPSSAFGRLVGIVIGSSVIPGYLGGPWAASKVAIGLIHPLFLLARLLTWASLAGIVVVSLLRRQAWRAWTLPLAYVGMSVLLLAFTRLRIVGPLIGLASRYVADSVPVFALGVALAFMVPLDRQGDVRWGWRSLLRDVPVGGAARARMTHRVEQTLTKRSSSRSFALAVIVLYAISAMITNSRMASVSDTLSPRDWLATSTSQLRRHPTASVFDSHLPITAIRPLGPGQITLFSQVARLSVALKPVAPRIRWDAPAENMLIFDDAGSLRPAEVVGGISARSSPGGGCVQVAGGTPVTVPLSGHLPEATWGVWLAYDTPHRNLGSLTVDGNRQAVTFLQGLHRLIMIQHGSATWITIESSDALCVGAVHVGTLEPRVAG